MTKLTSEIIQHNHAVFKQTSPTTYKCVKDMFSQISTGATISNQMLNCYLTIIPSAARVKIVECELYDKGED